MTAKVAELISKASEEAMVEYHMAEIDAIVEHFPRDVRIPVDLALFAIPTGYGIGYWDVDYARSSLERVIVENDLGKYLDPVLAIDQLLGEMFELASSASDFVKYNPLAKRTVREHYKDEAFEFLKQEFENEGFVNEQKLEHFLEPAE